MNEKPKRFLKILDFIYFPIFILFSFFVLAFLFVLNLSFSSLSFSILLIPMIGVIFLTFQYMRSDKPVESLNRLILIDKITLLLYLTFFLVFTLVLINPLEFNNFLFYGVVLSLLYRLYHILLIPLISIMLITVYYLKINIPIKRKRLSIILIYTISIIVLFIVVYFLLNLSVPILSDFYRGLPDFD